MKPIVLPKIPLEFPVGSPYTSAEEGSIAAARGWQASGTCGSALWLRAVLIWRSSISPRSSERSFQWPHYKGEEIVKNALGRMPMQCPFERAQARPAGVGLCSYFIGL